MSKLKIGLVLDDTLDSPDGVQQYILTLGSWLTEQGHNVHYLVGQTARHDMPNVHSLARNWRVRFNGNQLSIPLPANKRRLQALLEHEQFDVLHVQTPYSPLMAGRLIRKLKPDTALVGTFHILPYSHFSRLMNRLLALLSHRTASRFDTMIANSVPSKRFADTIYGFESVIIPNPFPRANFQMTASNAGTTTVAFLGRLVARKGAMQLLKALNHLQVHKLSTVPYRILIGGKGDLLSKLQAYSTDHGLDDVVSFVGFVAETDKPAFLAQADIAVFPSVSGESFGISLLEAMAAARGVVLGGDNPGYRSVLAPLDVGRLIKPDDTAAFADKLAYWLNNAKARQQAAVAQKSYVRQFDIPEVGAKIVTVYNEALRKRRDVR